MKGKYLKVKKTCMYVYTKILLYSGIGINDRRMNKQGKCEVGLLLVKEMSS